MCSSSHLVCSAIPSCICSYQLHIRRLLGSADLLELAPGLPRHSSLLTSCPSSQHKCHLFKEPFKPASHPALCFCFIHQSRIAVTRLLAACPTCPSHPSGNICEAFISISHHVTGCLAHRVSERHGVTEFASVISLF